MNYYTYYATGKPYLVKQAIFSVLSVFQQDQLHKRNDTKIIMHTDQPEEFQKFFKDGCEFIELRPLSRDDMDKLMVGPGYTQKNIHRLKLKIIEQIFEKYPGSKVMLLDSDTYLLESMQPHFKKLNASETFMHKDEGPIFKSMKPGLRSHRRFFEANQLKVQGKPFAPTRDFRMYNAGVVGMSSELLPLIKEMIVMHDDIFETTRYYNTEQFALSHVLQTKTNLHETDDVVRHYWYLKEFQATMDQFVQDHQNKSFQDLLNTKMPTNLPSYEGFKKLTYNVPYKIKKKLFEMNLIKGPYVTFE